MDEVYQMLIPRLSRQQCDKLLCEWSEVSKGTKLEGARLLLVESKIEPVHPETEPIDEIDTRLVSLLEEMEIEPKNREQATREVTARLNKIANFLEAALTFKEEAG